MSEIIDFNAELQRRAVDDLEYDDSDERRSIFEEEQERARLARHELLKTSKVIGPTRRLLAQNLGKLIAQFGRELSREELARVALKTSNIKASERLSRFQIVPGRTELSEKREGRLSQKPAQYLSIAEVAAELTGRNADQFVLALVDGTKFDPRVNDELNAIDLLPLDRLEEAIRKRSALIIKKCHVAEYVKLRDLYNVDVRWNKKESKYEYEAHAGERYQTVHISEVPLFSILRGAGEVEWRRGNEEWLRRPVDFLERVLFGLYCGEDGSIFPGFHIYPLFHVKRTKKKKGKRAYYPEFLSPLPDNIKIPWVGNRGVLVNIDKFGEVTPRHESFEFKPSEIDVLRLPEDHGIDLSKLEKFWTSRLLNYDHLTRMNQAVAKGVFEPLSAGAISRWLDIPIESIRRRVGDAFYCDIYMQDHRGSVEPKFDASRGISPPNSMMAEVEVGLFYDGFQGMFDDDSRDFYLKNNPFPDFEYDESGNIISSSEEFDISNTATFLDLIEYDVFDRASGLFAWLKSLRAEGLKQWADHIRELDRELSKYE